MRHLSLMPLRCRLIALAAGLCATLAHAQALQPLSPMAKVGAATHAELAERWWRWSQSFDPARSPVSDATGARCAAGRSGEVWFLAGTYSTDPVARRCKVPAGKTLIFPLVGLMARSSDTGIACRDLAPRLGAMADAPHALRLEVDGQRMDGLTAHRVASAGCFALAPGQQPDAVANGYYVALPPLPVDRHTVNFGGQLPNVTQALSYTLDME